MNGKGHDDLYAWSSSAGTVNLEGHTSPQCANQLSIFFEDTPNLAIATEASSHPSGILALEWQPWTWAGGGLGNIAECPLQTCIAGAGVRRDSLTFASLCIVPQCTARDLVADNFLDILEKSSVTARDTALGSEYTNLIKRITEINHFLGTGWTCGDFVVPWTLWPLGYLFFVVSGVFTLSVMVGSLIRCQKRARSIGDTSSCNHSSDPEKGRLVQCNSSERSQDNVAEAKDEATTGQNRLRTDRSIWRTFDLYENFNQLTTEKSRYTAILDGLRVGSICWIMVGHVMAITGSVAGFSNPKEVFPPSGFLASFMGQLVLSSRFAVETFLAISGFLTFYVLNRKLPLQECNSGSVLYRYFTTIPKLILMRAARILPLYLVVLLFYTQIAPHTSSGPFWYQWIALLKPCHDYFWTNLLFVNNFIPLDSPTTETCFYHSWYLAVDMQLFIFSSVLVFWYQSNPTHGRRATASLWVLSTIVGAYLAMVRHWSVNTFDGAAVARYDIEAYAKPHIRAQAYLTGMFVAMILPDVETERRSRYSWKHRALEALAVCGLVFVTFITYEGANSRRACQYQEWPEKNNCGSDWSQTKTWIYASLSRTLWCTSIGTLMHLYLGRHQGLSPISSILSWKVWAPLSKLSFAVYLIHPILIFMWELGSSEKDVFRPSTYGMNVVAVCVASYLVGLIVVLVVEMPAANLLRYLTNTKLRWLTLSKKFNNTVGNNGNKYTYGSIPQTKREANSKIFAY